MTTKEAIKEAFIKSLPIIGSYIFMSIAYGIMMEKSGFKWWWSFLASLSIYTGALQFVLVTMLSGGASIITVAFTTLFMNSRQFFYGLTFVEEFKKMKKKMLYMINTLTDETYAVNCSMLFDGEIEENNRRKIMFYVAVFSKSSWVIGTVIGGVAGQLIPMNLEGIDFCMTALFITIFIDQWKKTKIHIPAICGIVCGVIMLFAVGADKFMLPSLVVVSGILLGLRNKIEGKDEAYD